MKKTLAILGCTLGLSGLTIQARSHWDQMKYDVAAAKEEIKDAAYHAKEHGKDRLHDLRENVLDAAAQVKPSAKETHNVAELMEEKTRENVEGENSGTEYNEAIYNVPIQITRTPYDTLHIQAFAPGLEKDDNHHVMTNADVTYKNGEAIITIDIKQY